MDLHPFDRGPKGTFEGAVCANGSLYCPAVPDQPRVARTTRRGAATRVVLDHDRSCWRARSLPVRSPCKDPTRTATTRPVPRHGRQTQMPYWSSRPSPCPLSTQTSPIHLCYRHDAVASEASPRAAERQRQTRQKHPYPSPADRRSYARRTVAKGKACPPRPIRPGTASAAAGAACSARRRTPSCTHSQLYAQNIRIEQSRQRREQAEVRQGRIRGCRYNEGAGAGATSRARQANLS